MSGAPGGRGAGQAATARPVPVPDEQSAPYWRAAADHTLVISRCARCRAFTLPPDITCPRCLSTEPDWTWEPVSGRGTVRSWTVMRQSFLPGLADEVPFLLVDVELEEQDDLRMIGRLLDGPEAPVALGAAVRVDFEDLGTGVAVPAFRLAAAGGGS